MAQAILSLLILTLSFGFSLLMTLRVRSLLAAREILDNPNERSSHTVPVPRGGGWGILAVLIAGMVITSFRQHNFAQHGELILGVILLAMVSWRDDRQGVSAGKRLGVHLLAAVLGSLSFTSEQMLFAGALPFYLDRMIMIVGWAWFMNLYNFMDGIDGLTGSETVALATGTCLVMTMAGISDPFLSVLTLILTGSCLGFLALNWHPAKVFLGDVGSLPLGFLTGFGLMALALHGYWASAMILPLYYLADSGLTIAKRAFRREKIWQAHRQHFYQRAAQGLGRHDRVVYAVIAANLILIGLAIYAVIRPLPALGGAILTVALLLGWMHKQSPTNV